jgi:hypothetical protein
MPGIETAAPERTLTRSGLVSEPNFLPSSFSSVRMFFWTSSINPLGSRPPQV